MARLQALQVTEIVRMICEEVAWPSRKNALSLATTSRAFSDPALDIIWRELRSLVPLVKCMPESLWKDQVQGTNSSKKSVICLRRPMSDSDLQRFLFYSVRVKIVGFNELHTFRGSCMHTTKLHPEFLRALDMALPPSPMPRLSEIVWYPDTDDGLSIRHFLGPQIRKMVLRIEGSAANLSMLSLIKSSCPNLLDLNLIVSTDNPRSIAFISEVLCGFQRLTELCVPNLDQAGFLHVAQLPSLTALDLDYAKGSLYPPDFLPTPAFSALQRLYVRGNSARLCVGLIKSISSPRFESLDLRPLSSWKTASWLELHTALRDSLATSTVFHSIEVEESEDSPRPTNIAAHVLSPDTLRPLLSIKTLTTVKYQIYAGFDIDDDILKEMIQVWPTMESLRLSGAFYHTQPPRTTLNSLIQLARNCPKLYDVGFRMDATEVPEFVQVPGQRISNGLQILDVGLSPIDCTEEANVAAFISNLFPSLESLYLFGAGPPPEGFARHARSWNQVEALIPVFQTTREEDEEFWTKELALRNSEQSDKVSMEDEIAATP
ncbi:hypothetical protein R3P38DRAFT_2601554 [Favolaschia claudopus]|uniref:Uncharacterized protein n=1 Tax=Favolaschia claudopus TaxID=2862362 RepID=A0AAW0DM18_9AGAR